MATRISNLYLNLFAKRASEVWVFQNLKSLSFCSPQNYQINITLWMNVRSAAELYLAGLVHELHHDCQKPSMPMSTHKQSFSQWQKLWKNYNSAQQSQQTMLLIKRKVKENYNPSKVSFLTEVTKCFCYWMEKHVAASDGDAMTAHLYYSALK